MHDVAVIGAGLVGLATGRELLLRNPRLRVVLIEKEAAIGAHQSSHNSGVIHSGVSYTPGSLKARLCRDGAAALRSYCNERTIPYRVVGKLVVAADEPERTVLRELARRADANLISGVALLDAAEIREREPACIGIAALYTPQTAIVNYADVAGALAVDLREAGAEIRTGNAVTGLARATGGMLVRIRGGGAIEARCVVACAGLQADRVARMGGAGRAHRIVPFRGDYLLLSPERRGLANACLYPVPVPGSPFLGAHVTPRIDGGLLLGPNAVRAAHREAYRSSARSAREIVKAVRRYVPSLRAEDTLPGPCGIRAQAVDEDGRFVDDFLFAGDDRALHVLNAPSPAATACLAIARYIADEAKRRFALAPGSQA